MMSEEKILDDDSIGKNKYLEILLESRAKYKIPLLIFLTHSDDYCDNLKKRNSNEWKSICKDNLEKNKNGLLNHLQQLIESNYNGNFKMNESDIMHIVLVEPQPIPDKDIIESLEEEDKEEYDKGDEQTKKKILKKFRKFLEKQKYPAFNFLKNDMKILYPKELIKTIKEKLPSQYHSALNNID